MRTAVSYLFLVFTLTTVFFLILSYGLHPVLYTLEKDPSNSTFHSNIEAQKRLIINSSTDLAPLMQDILDYSGPITLNIRMKDMDAAKRDLDEYSKTYRSFNNLIINLDMNDSELHDLSNDAKNQNELLQELTNTSYSLDELKRLEIRYKDKDDQNGLTSVAMQGEALQKKIQSLRDRYDTTCSDLQNQSKQYDMDTTHIAKSRDEVDQYAKSVAAEQKKTETGTKIINHISFLIQPEFGYYGDEITYSGFISGHNISFSEVALSLDNQPFKKIKTDDIGQFRRYIQIEAIPSGHHVMTASWNGLVSDEQELTVNPVNSTLVMRLVGVKNQPVITTTGYLMTNRSVTNAPVHLIVNNETRREIFTNNRGNFSSNLSLPAGTYQIYTEFQNESYPINESTSRVYEVVSSGTVITSITQLGGPQTLLQKVFSLEYFIILVIGCGIIGLTAFFVWLRRRLFSQPDPLTTLHSPEETSTKTPLHENEKILLDFGIKSQETLFNRYVHCLHARGLSCAARFVYLDFVERISHDLSMNRPKTLTPHEVVRRTKKMAYNPVLRSFVSTYERIRYGGKQKDAEIKEFEEKMHVTDEQLGRLS